MRRATSTPLGASRAQGRGVGHHERPSNLEPRPNPASRALNAHADVHYVVTEHGVAELYGRSIEERVEALIAVADPLFRPELEHAVDVVETYFLEQRRR